MQRHGRNFIAYIPKEGVGHYSPSEVRHQYLLWYEGKRQTDARFYDLAMLDQLPNGRYNITTRQYTGHKYRPKTMKIGRKMFQSAVVEW